MIAGGFQDWTKKPPVLREINEWHEQLDRLIEGMIQDYALLEAASPRVDFSQDEHSYHIRAELPGVAAKDIDVSVAGDSLVIRGERKSTDESRDECCHYRERVTGGFYREIPLPSDASPEDVRAELKDGVLTVKRGKPCPRPMRATGKGSNPRSPSGLPGSPSSGQRPEKRVRSSGRSTVRNWMDWKTSWEN